MTVVVGEGASTGFAKVFTVRSGRLAWTRAHGPGAPRDSVFSYAGVRRFYESRGHDLYRDGPAQRLTVRWDRIDRFHEFSGDQPFPTGTVIRTGATG